MKLTRFLLEPLFYRSLRTFGEFTSLQNALEPSSDSVKRRPDHTALTSIYECVIMRRQMLYRLFKTSAFRLTATYLVAFLLFSVAGIYYFSWQARNLLTDYIVGAIEKETKTLNTILQTQGLNSLNREIARRIRYRSDYYYLLTTFNGFVIRTNFDAIPMEMMASEGWYEGHYFRYMDRNIWLTDALQKAISDSPWAYLLDPEKTADDNDQTAGTIDDESAIDMTPAKIHLAMAKITEMNGGLKLLVASNADELIRIDAAAYRSRGTALILIILFGVISGVYSVRRILKRVDSISCAMDQISAGQLSERLPLSGSGDELDRVAERVNAMLSRIENLMKGLQEVSDNIAHDLKTPLTRIHNKVNQALRMSHENEPLKEALSDVLSESDQLIKIFEALLQIARVEAGNTDVPRDDIDVSALITDMAELYEPLIEEEGMRIEITTQNALNMLANKELLGQALANLIENAIKYGARPDSVLTLDAKSGPRGVEISVSDQGDGIDEKDRERVLTRFTRLNESRSTPGSGLGLSLVAAVVNFHNGRLELRDNAPGLRIVMLFPGHEKSDSR